MYLLAMSIKIKFNYRLCSYTVNNPLPINKPFIGCKEYFIHLIMKLEIGFE